MTQRKVFKAQTFLMLDKCDAPRSHSSHKVFRKHTLCKQATTAQSMLGDLTLGEFVKGFSNLYETPRFINAFRVPATRPCIKLAELSCHFSYFSNITLNKVFIIYIRMSLSVSYFEG